ncbi:hypothetical protein [Sphingomonas paucimobilis]|uniref:hypothetical protein n=1 Tax=Sphingomonas paucimobilis TaxID=13689 RepID=UPI0020420857|nr:hypothetical protein [Sphingomonas paucimobilis]MCM3681024.1 hypothetical protein [Sphingomonas paucimobilis]
MTWISVKKLHYLLMRLAGGDPVTHRIASGRLYAADGDTRRFVVRSDMPQALYTFKVDHSLFRLAVDAMRIHSLATCGFETVSATSMKGLENFVVCRDPAPFVHEARDADIPGPIRVTLRIQMHQNDLFQRARAHAGDASGSPAPIRLTFIIGLLAAFHGTFTESS